MDAASSFPSPTHDSNGLSRRKSGRVAKAPERLISSAAKRKRADTNADDDEDSEDQDTQDASEDDDVDEDEPDEEELRAQRQKKRQSSQKKGTSSKRAKTNGAVTELTIRTTVKKPTTARPRKKKPRASAVELGGLYGTQHSPSSVRVVYLLTRDPQAMFSVQPKTTTLLQRHGWHVSVRMSPMPSRRLSTSSCVQQAVQPT